MSKIQKYSNETEKQAYIFLSRGIKELNKKDFSTAAVYFTKSVNILETKEGYCGLSEAYYNKGELEESINSLLVATKLSKEDGEREVYITRIMNIASVIGDEKKRINVFQELKKKVDSFEINAAIARLFSKQGDVENAIINYIEALAIKEDGQIRFELAMAYRKTGNIVEVVRNHQICAQEDPQHVVNLRCFAWLLQSSSYHREASKIFGQLCKKTIYWNDYHGWGNSLRDSGRYKEAISVLKNAINLVDSFDMEDVCCAYSALGETYQKIDSPDKAIKTWHKQLDTFMPIYTINDEEDEGIKISRHDLEWTESIFKEGGITFYPSLRLKEGNKLDKWKYLFYLHIRKCGGTSFASPLYQMKQYISGQKTHKQTSGKKKYRHLFCTSRHIHRKEEIPGLNKIIEDSGNLELNSAFYTTHGASWTGTYNTMSKVHNIKPEIFAIIRNSKDRLRSQIIHDASLGVSFDNFEQELEREWSEYDNTIYKYLRDYNLDSFTEGAKDKELAPGLDKLTIVDVSNQAFIAKVKTAFLSSSKLPNLLQFTRLNESSLRVGSSLSENQIEDIYNRFVDKGFIEKDQEIDNIDFEENSLKRNNFSDIESGEVSLNSETFIVANSAMNVVARRNEMEIVNTHDLLNNPIKYRNKFEKIRQRKAI